MRFEEKAEHARQHEMLRATVIALITALIAGFLIAAERTGRSTPMTPEERDYLRMRFEEEAEHARQHETLRATVTALMIALIAGLVAFGVGDSGRESGRQAIAGLLICGASVLGLLLNHVHEIRREEHLERSRIARETLKDGLSERIKTVIPGINRRGFSLRHMWMLVYILTTMIGLALFWTSGVWPHWVCTVIRPIGANGHCPPTI